MIWDYTYYWGILCQLYFQRRLTDLPMLSCLKDELSACEALNFAMQDYLRDWSACSGRRNRPGLLDQVRLKWFAELNGGLRDSLDDDAFKARIRQGALQLRQLAREIVSTSRREHPKLDATKVLMLLTGLPVEECPSMLFSAAALPTREMARY